MCSIYSNFNVLPLEHNKSLKQTNFFLVWCKYNFKTYYYIPCRDLWLLRTWLSCRCRQTCPCKSWKDRGRLYLDHHIVNTALKIMMWNNIVCSIDRAEVVYNQIFGGINVSMLFLLRRVPKRCMVMSQCMQYLFSKSQNYFCSSLYISHSLRNHSCHFVHRTLLTPKSSLQQTTSYILW